MTRPNRIALALALASALSLAVAAEPAHAQQVAVGNAATVVGDVRLSNAQIKQPRKIERKQRLAWGDLVATEKKSQLQILLLDRSSFGIGANSRVRIDRFVYDPEAGRSVFATVIKGALRFFSGRQEGANSATVETPAGRIGIRGTALDAIVGARAIEIAKGEKAIGKVKSNKDEATLVVLRGPGTLTEGGLTPGRAEVEGAGVTVTLDRPGLAAYIPRKGAAPIGPFAISDAALSQMQDELAPEVARAAEGGGLLSKLIPAAIGAATLGALLSGGDGDSGDTRTQQSRDPAPKTSTSPNRPPGQ